MSYSPVQLDPTEEQMHTLAGGGEVQLGHEQLSGEHTFHVTPTIHKRIQKAQTSGCGIRLKLSQKLLDHNRIHGSGFFGDLLKHVKSAGKQVFSFGKQHAKKALNQAAHQAIDTAKDVAKQAIANKTTEFTNKAKYKIANMGNTHQMKVPDVIPVPVPVAATPPPLPPFNPAMFSKPSPPPLPPFNPALFSRPPPPPPPPSAPPRAPPRPPAMAPDYDMKRFKSMMSRHLGSGFFQDAKNAGMSFAQAIAPIAADKIANVIAKNAGSHISPDVKNLIEEYVHKSMHVREGAGFFPTISQASDGVPARVAAILAPHLADMAYHLVSGRGLFDWAGPLAGPLNDIGNVAFRTVSQVAPQLAMHAMMGHGLFDWAGPLAGPLNDIGNAAFQVGTQLAPQLAMHAMMGHGLFDWAGPLAGPLNDLGNTALQVGTQLAPQLAMHAMMGGGETPKKKRGRKPKVSAGLFL